MKKSKLITFASMIAFATCNFSTYAEIKFKSIDNDGATNLVLVDSDAPEKLEVTDAVFINGGKEFKAEQIDCNKKIGGTAVYKLKFKRFTVFKNCKVKLTVNGKETTVDVQKAMTSHKK